MKLYLISQNVHSGYDTHDSAVVAAMSAADARKTHVGYGEYATWAHPKDVKAVFIGTAKQRTKAGVILESFNAG